MLVTKKWPSHQLLAAQFFDSSLVIPELKSNVAKFVHFFESILHIVEFLAVQRIPSSR